MSLARQTSPRSIAGRSEVVREKWPPAFLRRYALDGTSSHPTSHSPALPSSLETGRVSPEVAESRPRQTSNPVERTGRTSRSGFARTGAKPIPWYSSPPPRANRYRRHARPHHGQNSPQRPLEHGSKPRPRQSGKPVPHVRPGRGRTACTFRTAIHTVSTFLLSAAPGLGSSPGLL